MRWQAAAGAGWEMERTRRRRAPCWAVYLGDVVGREGLISRGGGEEAEADVDGDARQLDIAGLGKTCLCVSKRQGGCDKYDVRRTPR